MLTWNRHTIDVDLLEHTQAALLNRDLVTVETTWVQWTPCHVQESHFNTVWALRHLILPRAAIRRRLQDLHGQQQYLGMLWLLNDLHLLLSGQNIWSCHPDVKTHHTRGRFCHILLANLESLCELQPQFPVLRSQVFHLVWSTAECRSTFHVINLY